MKILLANGVEYPLVSSPDRTHELVNDTYMKAVVYSIKGSLSQIRADFNNEEALSLVTLISDEGKKTAEYAGYQKLVRITIPAESSDVESYIVVVSQTNDVKELIKSWTVSLEGATKSVAEAVNATAEAKTIAEETKTKVSMLIGNTDIDTMSLSEAKDFRIKESKEALQEYLAASHIKSSCHGGKEAEYSVTSEKQQYLISMISIAELSIANGVEYQPSWNARGEVCTYDWTVDELKQLAFEMEGFVRPLVSKQQTIESMIRECNTVEEVKKVEISY